MNNKALVIGLAVVLVLGGVALAQMNSGDNDSMMAKDSSDKEMMDTQMESKEMESDKMMEGEDVSMMNHEEAMKSEEMIKKDESMMKEEEMMKKDENMMDHSDHEMEGDSMTKTGAYLPYSSDKVAMAGSGDVVLFFKASWCPTCKALDTNIKSNLKDIPSGLTILEVDYDNSADLKVKYGVTYQHTFVQVDKDGNLIKKWTGSSNLAALVTEVQ
jgi:thiol-disulfide isomerase/thioredoxin